MKKIFILILTLVMLVGCKFNKKNNLLDKYQKAQQFALNGKYEESLKLYKELNEYEDSESISKYLEQILKLNIIDIQNIKDEEISKIYEQLNSIPTNNDIEEEIKKELNNKLIDIGIDVWIENIFLDIDSKNGFEDFYDSKMYNPNLRYDPTNNIAFKEFYYWFGNDKEICEWGNSFTKKVDYPIFDDHDKNYSYMYLKLYEDGSKPADKKFENLYSVLCYYNAAIKYCSEYYNNDKVDYSYDAYLNLCRISPNYDGMRKDEINDFVLKHKDIKNKDSWVENHEHPAIKEYEFSSVEEIEERRVEAQKKSDEEVKLQKEKEEQEREEYEKTHYEPKIGMTKEEVRNSKWGTPDKINKDEYSWGTTEQWVYEHRGYIYFENGFVTSIQHR